MSSYQTANEIARSITANDGTFRDVLLAARSAGHSVSADYVSARSLMVRVDRVEVVAFSPFAANWVKAVNNGS